MTKTASGERTAVLYGRLSMDKYGEIQKVENQLAQGRDLANRNGQDVVGEFSDNDISAMSGKARPDFERLMDLVRTGQIDGGTVIVFHLSRLIRSREERAMVIGLFKQHRVSIMCVAGPSYDLSTATGRATMGLLGEFDTMESEIKAERVMLAMDLRIKAGLPLGRLGYGWEASGTRLKQTYRVVPEEAAVIKEVARRLQAGESLLQITRDLNARGLSSPTGVGWHSTTLRQTMLRPSNAGIGSWIPKDSDKEIRWPGSWPAILSEQIWLGVVAILTRPERRTTERIPRPSARRYLLTHGVGECGVCGGELRRGKVRGVAKYACTNNHVGRDHAAVDAWVRAVVTKRLAAPDALDWVLGDQSRIKELGETLAGLNAKVAEVQDLLTDGIYTKAEATRQIQRLRPQIAEVEDEYQRMSRQSNVALIASVVGARAEQAWDGLSVVQRRELLEQLGVRVVIDSVGRGGASNRSFDPRKVRVIFPAAAEAVA